MDENLIFISFQNLLNILTNGPLFYWTHCTSQNSSGGLYKAYMYFALHLSFTQVNYCCSFQFCVVVNVP